MFTRYHVVIRNQHSFAEKNPFNFSPAKLLLCSLFVTFTLIACGLLLSNTLLRKWLNPAYLEQENTQKLATLYAALEELEAKNAIQDKFIASFQSALTGNGEPISSGQITHNDTFNTIPYSSEQGDISMPDDWTDVGNKASPNLLMPIYTAQTTDVTPSMLANSDYFASPVEGGVITTGYNAYEHYGVDIVGAAHAPIKSIAAGKVILAHFTVETGWVILIQHPEGILSLYKHNAVLLKRQNDVVQKGEVIAIMGNSGELTTGPHLHFEIWHDGHAMNPESVIKF